MKRSKQNKNFYKTNETIFAVFFRNEWKMNPPRPLASGRVEGSPNFLTPVPGEEFTPSLPFPVVWARGVGGPISTILLLAPFWSLIWHFFSNSPANFAPFGHSQYRHIATLGLRGRFFRTLKCSADGFSSFRAWLFEEVKLAIQTCFKVDEAMFESKNEKPWSWQYQSASGKRLEPPVGLGGIREA